MPSISPRYREELIESEKHFHDLLDRTHGKHREFERTGVAPEPESVPATEAESVEGARAETQASAGTTTPDTRRRPDGSSTG